jgi:nucleotide-binding universal stress UspA family protein
MKTILVGYDESAPSERALERAASLAELYGARLIVTSVIPVLVTDGSTPAARTAPARVGELSVPAEVVEAIGDPAEAIVEVAEQRGADLIVVGTREPSLVERLLGQSVSEGVQRRAHCDVLIVH